MHNYKADITYATLSKQPSNAQVASNRQEAVRLTFGPLDVRKRLRRVTRVQKVDHGRFRPAVRRPKLMGLF